MTDPSPGDPSQLYEAQLLERIAGGDEQALASLYDRFSRVLFSVAANILGNPKVAEDVLQDVFLQIWNKAGAYDRRLGKPLGWAMVLTRNKAIDHLRGLQKQSRLKDAVKEHQELPGGPLTDEQVHEQEIARTVRDELGNLPADQREAIELAFFAGLSQAEIATVLQAPLGTVKARIRRGMMKLREVLELDG